MRGTILTCKLSSCVKEDCSLQGKAPLVLVYLVHVNLETFGLSKELETQDKSTPRQGAGRNQVLVKP
jgi:hypothetical protein